MMRLSHLISLTIMASLAGGCLTKATAYPDPPFAEPVDDQRLLDFTKWEYRCFAMPSLGISDFEDTLNFYGSKGWELAALISDGGKTKQYCLKRKL